MYVLLLISIYCRVTLRLIVLQSLLFWKASDRVGFYEIVEEKVKSHSVDKLIFRGYLDDVRI